MESGSGAYCVGGQVRWFQPSAAMYTRSDTPTDSRDPSKTPVETGGADSGEPLLSSVMDSDSALADPRAPTASIHARTRKLSVVARSLLTVVTLPPLNTPMAPLARSLRHLLLIQLPGLKEQNGIPRLRPRPSVVPIMGWIRRLVISTQFTRHRPTDSISAGGS